MHVAVAPACNIQCHYCNRKYDCSNESRPGVVSEVLTPEQAVKKTKAVAAAIPQMTVLGIAGPGDPLANPTRTFETFRMLSEQAPDIKLCVSTNGLALPDSVEELAKHNIDHVTITINCVDPEVGAKIYPWIYWNNKRIHGVKAAKILIEQQQKGLEMLVAKGILVKVNSVMIPGVNDEHLKEVSRIVKQKGAFLHNVMPLIAEAEHGTFYGIMGQRGPEPEAAPRRGQQAHEVGLVATHRRACGVPDGLGDGALPHLLRGGLDLLQHREHARQLLQRERGVLARDVGQALARGLVVGGQLARALLQRVDALVHRRPVGVQDLVERRGRVVRR
ncbi:MAG TPA: nitrogenase cofactor biosynthesis protein NifB, partial [Cellvibrionaceae bacterium]|nr:nitrogenase cofactor biosynthesis protein NifB [Cellvibrionaceae bacterium]